MTGPILCRLFKQQKEPQDDISQACQTAGPSPCGLREGSASALSGKHNHSSNFLRTQNIRILPAMHAN